MMRTQVKPTITNSIIGLGLLFREGVFVYRSCLHSFMALFFKLFILRTKELYNGSQTASTPSSNAGEGRLQINILLIT